MDTIRSMLKERKNAHFLLVDGYSKLLTHQVLTCQSSVFNVSGLKWKLIIYPAGKDGVKDYLSFYVRIKDRESLGSDWIVNCNLRLSIISQTRPSTRSKHFELNGMCYDEDQALHGKECFMSRNHLSDRTNGFLVNDRVVFCAEINDVRPNFSFTDVVPRRKIGTAEHLKLIDQPQKNSRFTWKISQFSSFDSDGYHESYEFTFGQRRWNMGMNPEHEEEGKWLSLYLNARDYVTDDCPKAKTLAVFKLRVLDQLHCKHIEKKMMRWIKYYSGWGETQVVPLEKLNDPSWGYLIKDQIYVGVEFLLVSTSEYITL